MDQGRVGDKEVNLSLSWTSMGTAVQRLGVIARVPVGVEECPSPQDAGFQTHTVVLSGMHMRDALDSLIKVDPCYTWRGMDGLIVVRPATSWNDPKNLLNLHVGAVSWPDVTVSGALDFLFALLTGDRYSTASLPGWDQHFAVNLASATVLDVLNAIVRAHGELMWRVAYRMDNAGDDVSRSMKFGIGFTTYDGHSRWLWVPSVPQGH